MRICIKKNIDGPADYAGNKSGSCFIDFDVVLKSNGSITDYKNCNY